MKKFSDYGIAVRMTMAYLPLAIIIIALSYYTLSSLNRLNDINSEIINRHMAAIETCDDITNDLIAQESYGKKYLILKSEEMLALFSKRSVLFKKNLKSLTALTTGNDEKPETLKSLHDEYNELYYSFFYFNNGNNQEIYKEREDKIKTIFNSQLNIVNQILSENENSLQKKALQMKTLSSTAFYFAASLSLLGIIVGIGAALLITRNISRSLNQLKLAAMKFSQHQFDFVPDIHRKDEFGTLAKALTSMANQLSKLKAMDIDTNPLTRLPGGMAVEKYLDQKIQDKKMIAFCLFDIDNFKSYNDRYGYSRGNDVIKFTGDTIQQVVSAHIKEDFFVGHIGGDDFVVVIPHNSYKEICSEIINLFDKNIKTFYDRADADKGCIESKSRKGEIEKFPLMTISIAVVTNEEDVSISRIQIGEIAAEIKEHAKTFDKSIYFKDRRKKKR